MPPPDRHVTWEGVYFPGFKRTTTRVRYEAPYQQFSECGYGIATYIYGTGSFWGDGHIGEARFIVESTALPKEERLGRMAFDAQDEQRKTCAAISDGIFGCTLDKFMPKEDAIVVIEAGWLQNDD